jgi:DNA-directed RNA polymerase specialized sigma24 family protein
MVIEPDTDMGGAADRFPLTDHSAIVRLSSALPETRQLAFETIVTAYWKPVYKYVRIKWQATNEEAKDLVQGFFALAFEKNYFSGYDVSKAAFRTFLRSCVDGFVSNHRKSESRLKRGGGVEHLDFNEAEQELAQAGAATISNPEEYFHQEWVRHMFMMAVTSLSEHYRRQHREVHFRLFERYDLEDPDTRPTYATLAAEFGLKNTDVTNYLAAARREFRKVVLEKIREITATESEFQSEARSLLGVDVS